MCVWAFWFQVWRLEFGAQRFMFPGRLSVQVLVLGFKVWDLGLRAEELRVSGFMGAPQNHKKFLSRVSLR